MLKVQMMKKSTSEICIQTKEKSFETLRAENTASAHYSNIIAISSMHTQAHSLYWLAFSKKKNNPKPSVYIHLLINEAIS